MFKGYFDSVLPNDLSKKLYESKNRKKNNELVEEMQNRWSKLKYEIEKVSEDEKGTEKSDKILEIVKENCFLIKKLKITGFGSKNTNAKPNA